MKMLSTWLFSLLSKNILIFFNRSSLHIFDNLKNINKMLYLNLVKHFNDIQLQFTVFIIIAKLDFSYSNAKISAFDEMNRSE